MARGQKGYSLVELVVVVVLLGVLAAVAVPSLSGTRAIDDAAFVQDVRSGLRHAQRSAVAQRRTVCVAFTASTVSFTIASASGGGCTAGLTGPGGEQPFSVSTAGAGFTSVPTDFSFDSMGAASVGQTLSLAGTTIVVDAGTGYVR